MIQRDILTFTIANGASLSGAVDLRGLTPVRIIMPSAWTTANLTFNVSYDGVNFTNLYDELGTEKTVTAAASYSIYLAPADWVGYKQLKIRSGTSGTAVNQGGARTILVVCIDL